MKEPEDLFQQLFYAYQFFLNSSGVAGNRVDVAYLQFAPFFFFHSGPISGTETIQKK